MTAWIEVLTALTAGPDLPLRGTIHGVRAEGVSESFTGGFAYSGQPPMMVVPGHGCRVWRHGNKIRVENIDGEPIFISDGVRAWDFTGRSDRPLVGSPDRVIYLGPNQFLLHRRSAAEWAGNDFAQPAGEVEVTKLAGRECWTVQLAPPEGKPYPLRIWVDVESGQMLGYRIDEVGEGSRFVDVTVGETMDEALFVWDGPAVTPEEHQQLLRDEQLAAQREQVQWFTNNVTDAQLTVRVPVDFTPDSIRSTDSGGFDASNRVAMLSRRPRSVEGWEPKWGVPHYVWSTPLWDWAAGTIHADLDRAAVDELRQRIHPGEAVDRDRRIDPPGRGGNRSR
ncbi:hypothetical protein PXH69_21855 [Rhodococcus qingshengii]|uniref:Uncharacterized protein n=1 Tax=Rhodococcus qingshengii TaxID=334542 RepID=A0AAW6LLL2_RHOSG|nr:hypothetical protein [Rhodococcus qingshengii]MDE8647624.1 hypothetical protein [Rhodococcus qingshengii]